MHISGRQPDRPSLALILNIGRRQRAKLIVDVATGEVEDREATPEEQGKSAAAVAR